MCGENCYKKMSDICKKKGWLKNCWTLNRTDLVFIWKKKHGFQIKIVIIAIAAPFYSYNEYVTLIKAMYSTPACIQEPFVITSLDRSAL